jgi:hypothetical protein
MSSKFVTCGKTNDMCIILEKFSTDLKHHGACRPEDNIKDNTKLKL